VKRILGLLGWLGVVLVLAALAFRFTKPELNIHPKLALAGLIVTAIYALSQWRDIGRSFQGKDVKYGSFALGSVLAFLAILVAINWIANRQNKRWDLTSGQQFSMSDQTKKIVSELKSPVVVRVFHGGQEGSMRYRDLLDEYQYLSKQLTVQYIEADRDPIQAQKYEITSVPTILIEHDGRTERTQQADEQGLTNALKKAIEGKAKKVYFVQGHGEKDPTGTDAPGYKAAADGLTQDNFEVAKTNLQQTGKVPDDATVLVIAGPTIDFFPSELEAVKAFLKRGGKVMLMIDPPTKTQTTQPASLIALAKEWGINFGNNLVVDASGIGQLLGTDASVPIAMPLQHPANSGFREATAFPLARSVTPIEGGAEGKFAAKLVETRPEAWGESDLKGLYETGRPKPNEPGDMPGPITIAAASSAPAADAPAPAAGAPPGPKPESRFIAVGDSDFASNRAIGLAGNKNLFLNMSNWLAQQEDLIAIRPKDPDDRRITLTQDQGQRIFWLTMFIIPGLLFANGIRVWWKRR
jgi:ABC-type uncharacterized transport system involved in gliding motility auxiliary subunit